MEKDYCALYNNLFVTFERQKHDIITYKTEFYLIRNESSYIHLHMYLIGNKTRVICCTDVYMQIMLMCKLIPFLYCFFIF